MSTIHTEIHSFLLQALKEKSSPEKAVAAARYFPDGFICLGAKAADISEVARLFTVNYAHLSPQQVLELTEFLLENHQYNEEVLLAFALINKHVKKHFNDELLLRFQYWLEHYCSNWAHVDDLCLKTVFPFLMARPYLITQTQKWVNSNSPWCRRASNVVWVKFIQRKIGKTLYKLDKELVFQNCRCLMSDPDEFVQKSIGWLLKVTLVHYPDEVINFVKKHHQQMPRATIRYALEKLETNDRKALLASLN